MKRLLTLFIAIISITVISLSLSACKGGSKENSSESYSVTVIYNNGKDAKTFIAPGGKEIEKESPKKDGYIFVGWCTDEELTNFYDFNNKLDSDITLYAKWSLDYENLVSDITREAISFTVKVTATYKNYTESKKENSIGSGVVYSYKNGHYYILTNNHVVKSFTDTSLTEYFVYDMYGNEYDAKLVISDSSYDLAVLKIQKKENVSLKLANIIDSIPNQNQTTITITSPQGQLNAIEFGEIVDYKSVNVNGAQSELSNVSFEVFWLTNYSNHGSSGGVVLNENLKAIGIVYGVATDSNGSFKYTFAIPGAKIIEFINSIKEI